VTEHARDHADAGRRSAGQDPARVTTSQQPETEPAPAPLRASSVRAFTPREAHVPKHRADVPTDWVGDHDGLTEHRQVGVAATA